MNITAIKTDKILPNQTSINYILQKNIHTLAEYSIVVITSKIVSMCEGAVLKKTNQNKSELAQKEADFYLPHTESKYDVTLTLKNNLLIPSAGIDESNSDGHFVFWPRDPQQSANSAREFLKKQFTIKHVGVIISDSKTTPLRWGTTGTSITYSGFDALNDFIGKPDIFGRDLTMTKVNVVDALATAAVLTMGESNEQTPLAIISDIPFVRFQDRNPNDAELQELHISIEDDVYAPLLTSVQWKKSR